MYVVRRFVRDLTNRRLGIWSRDPLDQSYGGNMDFEPSIRKVPLLLNSVNIDGMLVQFLLKNDVDHRISSETFVYRPDRPFLFGGWRGGRRFFLVRYQSGGLS